MQDDEGGESEVKETRIISEEYAEYFENFENKVIAG